MGKKTKEDPTGQANNRKKATRTLQMRVSMAESRIKRTFRTVPRTRRREAVLRNQETATVYDYDLPPVQQERLENEIRAILDDELLETQFNQINPIWYWLAVIELPFRQGTAEEIVQFNRIVTAEIIRERAARGLATQTLDIQQVLQSSEYLDALNRVNVENFATIKNLSNRTADQVIQQINLGVSGGESPSTIAKNISERFDVSRSSAKRIADTSINKAYNDAKINAVDVAATQTGLRAGVIHISALLPTTRPNHAARHGNAYTTAQQQQWWNEGTNRINCHCTTRSVLINRQGRVVDVESQEEIQAEREFFDQ